ncbi:NHL repeat-containing protein [Hymenobacter setariae]|uniref:hypothetical protein n=1 Tax=Hymenobacter setariae TaxID=2594794 RepID=UPI001F22D2B9|nr:hypothetical protein [Hymenobacter setariae]
MKQPLLYTQGLRRLVVLAGLLLSLLPRTGKAQFYYVLNDGSAATTLDQLRLNPLTAVGETPLTTSATNTVAAPGAIALDPAGNRVFIADVRNNAPKIVAVSLSPPYAVTTFLTPAAISGASATSLGGLAVDRINGYLYYLVSDANATTSLDQLRRSPLGTAAETTLASGFVNAPGALALDLPNNRLLVADRRNKALKIAAVNLTAPYATSTFQTVAAVPGAASSTIGGLVVDNTTNYLYYTVDDGNAMTSLDELRRSPLSAPADTKLISGFVNTAGPLVLDAVGNRLLAADGRRNAAKVVAISLTAPYATSTLLTPTLTTGTSTALLRGLALPTTAAPLPVTLVDFSAQLQGAAVQLTWATASERNSAYFDVERSTDGVSFTQVGHLAAAGTSATAHRYSLLDATLPQGATPLYYRLHQVDLDGTGTYSTVRTVARVSSDEAAFAVYPTVVGQRVNYSYSGPPLAAGLELEVYDATGRCVRKQHLTEPASTFEVATLAPGWYWARLAGTTVSARFYRP